MAQALLLLLLGVLLLESLPLVVVAGPLEVQEGVQPACATMPCAQLSCRNHMHGCEQPCPASGGKASRLHRLSYNSAAIPGALLQKCRPSLYLTLGM